MTVREYTRRNPPFDVEVTIYPSIYPSHSEVSTFLLIHPSFVHL